MDFVCEEEIIPKTPKQAVDVPETESEKRLPNEMQDDSDVERTWMIEATVDINLLTNPEILQNMLKLEEKLQAKIHPVYLETVQTEITGENRSKLISWIFEVSEEEGWMDGVFLRTVSYVDRFLSIHKILNNQLQLLGVACLVLSLKWSGTIHDINKLINYTGNSVSKEMLIDWEIMVLYAINWELDIIVSSDFIQQFLPRLPSHVLDNSTLEKVRIYLAVCATDQSFIIHSPSLIATSALVLAIECRVLSNVLQEIIQLLTSLTSIDQNLIQCVITQIKNKIAQEESFTGIPLSRL